MLKIPVFHLPWPNGPKMSTHELVISSEYVYVTGQNNGYVAQIGLDGQVHNFFPMLDERGQTLGPHGLLLDAQQRLWVSLEFIGQVVRLDENGHIVERINVNMSVEGSKRPINPAPRFGSLANAPAPLGALTRTAQLNILKLIPWRPCPFFYKPDRAVLCGEPNF
jgi:hypothetical protein